MFSKTSYFMLKRVSYVSLMFVLVFMLVFPPQVVNAQSLASLNLPVVGVQVGLTEAFVPIMLKGVSIDVNNPLNFSFLVESGDSEGLEEEIKKETESLVKYFLAALTVPEEDWWVNLSPYEGNRIIAKGFGETEMGRDLLAQDYVLKQLSASLMSPEGEIGKKFWEEIKGMYREEGVESDSVDIFNKVWIVPDEALVFENEGSGYVVKSRLKVMMEEDYLARESEGMRGKEGEGGVSIMRSKIIPKIEKEVNEGKQFARLRQIYNALILAKWYKETINNKLLEQVYVGKNKVEGISVEDREISEKIYQRYVESYKKGVFNYVAEEYDEQKQGIKVKRYFSGGADLDFGMLNRTEDPSVLPDTEGDVFNVKVSFEEIDGRNRNNDVPDLGMLDVSWFGMILSNLALSLMFYNFYKLQEFYKKMTKELDFIKLYLEFEMQGSINKNISLKPELLEQFKQFVKDLNYLMVEFTLEIDQRGYFKDSLSKTLLSKVTDPKMKELLLRFSSEDNGKIDWDFIVEKGLNPENKDKSILNGGIDFQGIDVERKGRIDIEFDFSVMNTMLQNGIEGFQPVIIQFKPISNVYQFLGLKYPIEDNQMIT